MFIAMCANLVSSPGGAAYASTDVAPDGARIDHCLVSINISPLRGCRYKIRECCNFKRVPPQRSLTSRRRKPENAAPPAFQVIAHNHEPGGETATSNRNFAPPPDGVVTERSLS
jgi:hypothetical protein